MGKYNIHAGHCPDGGVGSGAVGILYESTEARKVKDLLSAKLKSAGHTVYDCTCNTNVNPKECLYKIVSECNQHKVDLDISIHLNAGVSDYQGNSKNTGTEVWVYSSSSSAYPTARKICEQISANMGYRNRGVKTNPNFYVLRKTSSPAILIECCFVDDVDDAVLWNPEKCANAIYEGITNLISIPNIDTSTTPNSNSQSASNISNYQSWLNRNYSTQIKNCKRCGLQPLSIDGLYGTKTKAASCVAYQVTCNTQLKASLIIDGIYGPQSKKYGNKALVKYGSKGSFVYIVEGILYGNNCYFDKLDGIASDNLKRGIYTFQTQKNISRDSLFGANSYDKAFNS